MISASRRPTEMIGRSFILECMARGSCCSSARGEKSSFSAAPATQANARNALMKNVLEPGLSMGKDVPFAARSGKQFVYRRKRRKQRLGFEPHARRPSVLSV